VVARSVVTIVASAAALAACGGSDSPLEQTVRNLDDIRSGVLHLQAAIEPEDSTESFSYQLTGPFEFPEDGGAASADLRYRQSRGDVSQEARLVAVDGRGWVEVDGERRDLTENELRGLVVGTEDGTFLADLDLESWFMRHETRERGDRTLEISGEAHAARTLEGLMGLGGGFGGQAPVELDDEAEEAIDRIARSSRLRVVTGADDHLLRALRYDVSMGFNFSRELRAALGDIAGARLSFELRIDSQNEPVDIRG
jgi:hypothetical protein